MKTTGMKIWVLGCSLAFVCGQAMAQQETAPGDKPVKVVGGPDEKAKPEAGPLKLDGSDINIEGMSDQEIAELVKKASAKRLAFERKQAAAEIDATIIYDDDDKATAIAELDKGATDGQLDNLARIAKAFAAVDGNFSRPYKMYQEALAEADKAAKSRKPEDAKSAMEKFLAVADAAAKEKKAEETTYLGAAKYLLHADALARSSELAAEEAAKRKLMWDAVDSYSDLCQLMPDRVSFAALAAQKAAELYSKMGREIYAMKMYEYCLKQYGLTMEAKQAKAMLDRLEDLKKKYEDPMGTVTKLMGEIQDLFKDAKAKARADEAMTQKQEELIRLLAGSQDKQNETIAILDDLIKTAEEANKQRQQQQKKQQERQQRQGEGQGEGEGQGQKPGQGKGKGNKPQGAQQPSSPAQTSALVPGAVERPKNITQDHSAAGEGNWSELAPEKAAELENVSKKTRSERYNDVVRDFNRRMAELGSVK